MTRTPGPEKMLIAFPAVLALMLLALAAAGDASADLVFHWVDDNGVAHFSDRAPEHAEDVTTLVISAKNPLDYDPDEDPYSINKQAERTSETWIALATQREERREKRREAEERERDTLRRDDYEPYPYYPTPYYYGPIHLPGRPPGHHPRPPQVRPPIYPDRPVWPVRPTSEWTDPMRSAHIGVKRKPPPNSGTK